MIAHIRQYNKSITEGSPVVISVEIEKAKSDLDCLISLPDVIFVSKDYAIFKGYTNMKNTIEKIKTQALPG